MKFYQIKTYAYLCILTGLFIYFGWYVGGWNGFISALFFSSLMNGFAYFYSDKMVLTLYRAQPLDNWNYGWIHTIVEDLCKTIGIPKPKLWLINNSAANAMATGRNPQNASVAITSGILDVVNQEELRGILAHELSHIKNRDILVNSLAATFATGIGYMSNIFRTMGRRIEYEYDNQQRRGNPLGRLLVAILLPFAALLIRLAVTRSREYLADETGSEYSHDPLALASALQKLEESKKAHRFNPFNPLVAATAHMFIINPFLPYGWRVLFSTHPPVALRIERLKKMHERMQK